MKSEEKSGSEEEEEESGSPTKKEKLTSTISVESSPGAGPGAAELVRLSSRGAGSRRGSSSTFLTTDDQVVVISFDNKGRRLSSICTASSYDQ